MLSRPSVIPIHTAVKGRAWLKVEALVRSEALKFGLENHFTRRPHIRSASASTTTGSLLVHYSGDLLVLKPGVYVGADSRIIRSAALAHESLTAARLHAYNCRRRDRHPGTNRYLGLATAASFALQLAPYIVPGLRRILKIAPVTPVDLAIAGANAGLALIINSRLRRRIEISSCETRRDVA
jgi:hypothetical protein